MSGLATTVRLMSAETSDGPRFPRELLGAQLPGWPSTIDDPSIWSEVDGPTLLAVVSALQLRPDNADTLVRLGRLAGVAATLPERPDARRLSSSTLRRLLSVEEVGGPMVRALEDPYEGLFGLELPFFSGPKLVVQGQATHAGKVVESLLTAIFGAPTNSFSEGFVVRSRTLASLLLRVSDAVSRKAGITRLTAASDASPGVNIPKADSFPVMANWVRFDVEEIFGQYPEPARAYLENLLVREQGSAWSGELDEGLIVKPFVRGREGLVVGAPTELMATLRHHIVVDAHESACATKLARRLHEVTVDQAWDLLGGSTDTAPVVVQTDPGWTSMSAQFDGDKTLDVFVLSDDLQDYNPGSPYGEWHGQPTVDRAVEAANSFDSPGPRLRLFIYQGMGRDLAAGFPSCDDEVAMLVMSIQDLESILQTPGTDGLSLWYFAQASTRFHQRAQVISFSAVDLWSTYEDNKESFYLSDNEPPSAVLIASGSGQDLRVDNARRVDRRHLVHPLTRTVCEAYSMHGPDASGVYMVRGSGGVSFYADMGNTSGWVHVGLGVVPHSGDSGLFEVGEAVAYWLWQLYVHDSALIEDAAIDGVVELFVYPADVDQAGGPWIRMSLDSNIKTSLEVCGPPVVDGDEAANAADRVLLAAILATLGPAGGDSRIVDAVAPAGPKRMMHALGSDNDPQAWPGRLGEAWHVREAAIAQILDEMGQHLVQDKAMQVGPIKDDERTSVLNDVVARWLIDSLTDLLSQLSIEGLVERLIDRNEALVSSTARESVHLPSRIACFGAKSDEVERIAKHQHSADTSMMASRFLVEYVSAFPPNGTKPLSRERYDRALGLASEIVNKGMLSDSIQHGLSTTQLSILESGRLGADADEDQYMAALGVFATSRAERSYARAGLEDDEKSSVAHNWEDVDPLAEREFGFSYTDLAVAVRKLLDLMDDADHADVLSLNLDELQQALGECIGRNNEKVGQLISQLSLAASDGSVEEFWGQGVSVRPWRFSRARSYLRRPIVLSSTPEGVTATIGRRALWHTVPYWTHQFTSGRLQATTRAMRSALNRRRQQKGDQYERRVADQIEKLGYTHVRRRMRRIGEYDFRNVGGRDLGDVDVVGVHVNRRELLLLEIKDLEVARTPAELANEVKSLVGEGHSAVRRLLERSAWIESHLYMTLTQLGVSQPSGRWHVRPVVVVNEPLLSESLLTADVPIVSHELLSAHLGQATSGRNRQRRR
jgi:hypothetical protein